MQSMYLIASGSLEIVFLGIAFLVINTLLCIFANPFGKWFCRTGKRIWQNNSLYQPGSDWVERIYDENKAPTFFRWMGALNLVLGVPAFAAIYLMTRQV